MKIGLVRRGHSTTGGAEAYLIRLASALQTLGHFPVLVTTANWPDSRWINDQIIRLDGESPEEFAAAFRATKTGCDIHLSMDYEPFWRRATRWVNRKHNELLGLENQVFDPKNTRAIIANSKLVRDEILAHSAFPAEKVHVVYNGLSSPTVPADRDTSRAGFGIEGDELCALFVGSGWDRKGLRTAIRAVEKMKNASLLVAGRGPADAFRSGSAKFVGPTNDLAALFGAADVFVLPTYYDPFSNACLEALAAGLPVITTPSNGFSEILISALHGAVVPEGDSVALANEMEKWRDPQVRANSRHACLARAAEFSIERNALETLRILQEHAVAL